LSAHAAPLNRPAVLSSPSILARVSTSTWLTLGIAAVLCAVCFEAGGGLQLGSQTTVEIGLTLGGTALVVGALAAETRAPLYGAATIALIFALAIFTAVSVIWSVAPDGSFVEAGRTLAYAFALLGGVALVRLAPQRFASLLVGVLLASVVVSTYALASKVFPNTPGSGEIYARLRDPFGYWNAVGLTAALGVPACIWLGARRTGHAALGALAYPALMLLLVTVMLAYSRGALLALVVGMAFWFATVPLRLRGLSVVVLGVLGAVPVVLWTFAQDALSADNVALGPRAHFGHLLGLMIVGVAVLVTIAGLCLRFATAARPPSAGLRRRIGTAALVALALVPVALAGSLAVSSRGLGGSVSHAWRSLTDPNATTPPNDPSRLTAIGSVRARYWNDALKIWQAHPLIGVGSDGYATARLRVRTDTLGVQNAHGYVVQTLADLGIVGMVISLLLCAAWVLAAIRTADPFGRRLPRDPLGRRSVAGLTAGETAERIGLLTLITCVIVFTIHSAIDITWFVPGDAVIGLVCAGWVAGRGPFRSSLRGRAAGRRGGRRGRLRAGLAGLTQRPARAAGAGAVVVLGLAVAWSQWQPLRSQDAQAQALTALSQSDYAAAKSRIQTAISRDPLSVDALFDLSTIDTAAGDQAGGRAALVQAVRLAPSNPRTWEELATFDASNGNRTAALADLGPALYLDPESYAGISQYLDTLRGLGTTTPTTPTAGAPAPSPGASVTPGATATPQGTTATPGATATTPPTVTPRTTATGPKTTVTPKATGTTAKSTGTTTKSTGTSKVRPGAAGPTPGETPALTTPGTR
jgi:O-antigen ligase